MTVAFESGYTLPSGDLPLNHARVLHDGNRFKVKTVTASSELAMYPGSAANSGDTVDRWRPFANVLADPTDFSTDSWTPNANLTVASDGQTLNEGTTAAVQRILNIADPSSITYTATEWVLALRIERQTCDWIAIFTQDSAASGFGGWYNVAAKTTGSALGGGVRDIVDLGNEDVLVLLRFTPAAGAASALQFFMVDADNSSSYTGTNRTVKIKEISLHKSTATLSYDLFTAQEGDTFAIAAHNLWSSGATLTLEHDRDDDGVYYTLGSVTPTDNSPVMFIYEPITSAKWRIQVSGGALPEIGVFRVGKSLQMERPFYGGFTIPRMARNTVVRGNISGSGELLGRSKERTTLRTQYQWQHLTYDWVRANLDGPTGLIQAAESEPVFLAWRPSVTQDVDYVMRASTDAPNAMGLRDLWTFGMSGEAHSYE